MNSDSGVEGLGIFCGCDLALGQPPLWRRLLRMAAWWLISFILGVGGSLLWRHAATIDQWAQSASIASFNCVVWLGASFQSVLVFLLAGSFVLVGCLELWNPPSYRLWKLYFWEDRDLATTTRRCWTRSGTA
jgi:hypothetical protein